MLISRVAARPRRTLLIVLLFVIVAGVLGGPVAGALKSEGGFVAPGADSEVATGRMVLSRTDLNALGEAFGLTVAETNILGLLGQGRSLGEIAAIRGVEFETVRGQCKLLLAKTRSRKQSDLVKLVVALCAHGTD